LLDHQQLCNGSGATVGGGVSGCTAYNAPSPAIALPEPVPAAGGAYNSILNNCTLSNNQADFNGGGASGCTMTNLHADRQLRVVRRRRSRGRPRW